jgi:hypothetical protein
MRVWTANSFLCRQTASVAGLLTLLVTFMGRETAVERGQKWEAF